MIKFAISLGIVLFSAPALADWEGSVQVRVYEKEKPGSPEINGYIRMKQEFIRMDTSSILNASAILNTKTGKSQTIIHPIKVYTENDLAKFQGQVPVCAATNIDECLQKQGFKKIGEETVEGHKCFVYESEGQTKVKLWRPIDLKEVPSIKMLATESSGKKIESVVSQIKLTPQSDSFFRIPEGYRPMDDLKALFK